MPARTRRAGRMTKKRARDSQAFMRTGIVPEMRPAQLLDWAAWMGPCPTEVAGGKGRWRYSFANADARACIAHVFEETLAHEDLLGTRTVLSHASSMYALRTFEPTMPATQGWHTDYPRAQVEPLADNPGRVPLSALWSPFDGFYLVVADLGVQSSHEADAQSQQIWVPKGHVVVFRGDVWHGGGPHFSAYPRAHAYAVEPNFVIKDAIFA